MKSRGCPQEELSGSFARGGKGGKKEGDFRPGLGENQK